MQIIQRPLGDTTVLELHGVLTAPAATDLLDTTVRGVTRTAPRWLVLNLGDVPSIDAAGLGALVAAYGVVKRSGGTLRLARVGKRVHALLVVCGLITVFETFASVEDAVASGAGGRPGLSTMRPPASQLSPTSLVASSSEPR
jgi:anti-sigma B factor antagonist